MAIATPIPVLADLCRNPKITVVNERTSAIRVNKIKYYDGCDNKWRTENVSNVIVDSGFQNTYTDNLGYVGNCVIEKFKVYRQTCSNGWSNYSWGGVLIPDQGSGVVCNTGAKYTIRTYN